MTSITSRHDDDSPPPSRELDDLITRHLDGRLDAAADPEAQDLEAPDTEEDEPDAMAGSPPGWLVAADEPVAATAQEEREQRVLSFIEAHQPELTKVLANLEKRKPAEYARAIEELDRSVQPLTSGKSKDPRLHELDVRAWQARTRVELLGARVMAGKEGKEKDREELERQLREAIAAEFDIRAERLTYRKQRSAAWYDRQINRLSEKRDALIAARPKAILE